MSGLRLAALASIVVLMSSGSALGGPKGSPPSPFLQTAISKQKPPKEPRAGKQPPTAGAWLERADSTCREGLRDTKAVIDAVRRRPPGSARAALLTILQGSSRVEAHMLAQLATLDPPKLARKRFARTQNFFRRMHAEHVRLLGLLRRRWDARALERQLERDAGENARLANLWSALGSEGCTEYFRSPAAGS